MTRLGKILKNVSFIDIWSSAERVRIYKESFSVKELNLFPHSILLTQRVEV